MPHMWIHLRTPSAIERGFAPVEFDSLEQAYLDVCEAIPDTAADMMRRAQDPAGCAYLICDLDERLLETVPFADVLRAQAAVGLEDAPTPPGDDASRGAPRAADRSDRMCGGAIGRYDPPGQTVSHFDAGQVALADGPTMVARAF